MTTKVKVRKTSHALLLEAMDLINQGAGECELYHIIQARKNLNKVIRRADKARKKVTNE